MAVFRIQRLTPFVREQIVSLMRLQEQYDLGTLSYKAQNLVKLANRHCKQHSLQLDYYNRIRMTVIRKSDESCIAFEIPHTGKRDFSGTSVSDVAYRCMISSVGEFSRVFNVEDITVRIFPGLSLSRVAFSLLPSIKLLGMKLGKVYVDSHKIDDEAYKAILKACRNARELILRPQVSQDFCLDPAELGELRLDNLFITYDHWVTMDHVIDCFMGCRKVDFRHAKLDQSKMNAMLRKWVAGCSPEKMTLPIEDVDYVAGLKGITTRPHGELEGYLVRLASGMDALIGVCEDSTLLMTTRLEI